MSCVNVIILLTFATQAYSKEESMDIDEDKLVEQLINNLNDRAFKALTLDHGDLDATTMAKTHPSGLGHATPYKTKQASFVRSPLVSSSLNPIPAAPRSPLPVSRALSVKSLEEKHLGHSLLDAAKRIALTTNFVAKAASQKEATLPVAVAAAVLASLEADLDKKPSL
jgi:hypothetical protein